MATKNSRAAKKSEFDNLSELLLAASAVTAPLALGLLCLFCERDPCRPAGSPDQI